MALGLRAVLYMYVPLVPGATQGTYSTVLYSTCLHVHPPSKSSAEITEQSGKWTLSLDPRSMGWMFPLRLSGFDKNSIAPSCALLFSHLLRSLRHLLLGSAALPLISPLPFTLFPLPPLTYYTLTSLLPCILLPLPTIPCSSATSIFA